MLMSAPVARNSNPMLLYPKSGNYEERIEDSKAHFYSIGLLLVINS